MARWGILVEYVLTIRGQGRKVLQLMQGAGPLHTELPLWRSVSVAALAVSEEVVEIFHIVQG